MTQYIDIKYLGLLSPRLQLFKVKNHDPYTANCRCPICGDSKKSKWKARGYFFTKKGGVFYKCHNCGYSSSIGSLLKQLDSFLYNQYTLERFKEGKTSVANVSIEFTKPDFESRKQKSLLDSIFDRIDGTPAEKYLEKRQIPKNRWSELYYIDDVQKLEQLSERYKDRIVGSQSRLVIPFYNRDGEFVGVTCRALGDESLRYLTVRLNDTDPFVYNLDKIDITKDVYVTEGPLDSLFLNNAVAAGSSDLNAVRTAVPKEKLVLVFDNQPRNKELVSLIEKAIDDNYKLVIWPENISQKDINEMYLAGIAVQDIINQNTFSGLELKLKYTKWKRI